MEMPSPDPKATALVESLAALDPRVSVRKMFGQTSAFVNGRMCFGSFGPELILRLADTDLAEAASLPGAHPFEPMAGRPMRGYVAVALPGLGRAFDARSWALRAIAHTVTLAPGGRTKAAAPARADRRPRKAHAAR